jgi:hypothetical protein
MSEKVEIVKRVNKVDTILSAAKSVPCRLYLCDVVGYLFWPVHTLRCVQTQWPQTRHFRKRRGTPRTLIPVFRFFERT